MTADELSSKLEAACLLIGPYGRFTIEARSEPMLGSSMAEFKFSLEVPDMRILIEALRRSRGLV